MTIAVSYLENGTIYNHFGDSHKFKIYNITQNEITSTEVIHSETVGHEPLAQLLHKHNVEFLITGDICDGGVATLKNYGIQVCAGIDGTADEQVNLFILKKLLVNR